MSKAIVLSSAYLPPIAWFQYLIQANEVFIESHEHYLKQSYRNRCKILSANGILDLSIPVKHLKPKQLINEVQMEENHPWRKQHWQSLCSAYGKSAFFLYYKDAFENLYLNPTTHNLFEFNQQLLQLILRFLKIEISLQPTSAYHTSLENTLDLRSKFDAKSKDRENELLLSKPYLQVFSEKFRFEPNLSVVDLLFSQGPMAKEFLR